MNLLIKNVILPDGDKLKTTDIAVVDGIIAKIGCADENFKADEIIEGNNRLAIPAFVNAHTHMYMSTLRNAADDLPFMEWLFNGVMPKEDRLNGEQAYWGSLLSCAEMIKRGCATFCAEVPLAGVHFAHQLHGEKEHQLKGGDAAADLLPAEGSCKSLLMGHGRSLRFLFQLRICALREFQSPRSRPGIGHLPAQRRSNRRESGSTPRRPALCPTRTYRWLS